MTLLEEFERFQRATGIAESTFGLKAVGRGDLIAGLRRGVIPRTDTYQRCLDFIAIEVARFKAEYP